MEAGGLMKPEDIRLFSAVLLGICPLSSSYLYETAVPPSPQMPGQPVSPRPNGTICSFCPKAVCII